MVIVIQAGSWRCVEAELWANTSLLSAMFTLKELGELMALSTDGFWPGDDRGEMKQVILQPTSEPDFQIYAGEWREKWAEMS